MRFELGGSGPLGCPFSRLERTAELVKSNQEAIPSEQRSVAVFRKVCVLIDDLKRGLEYKQTGITREALFNRIAELLDGAPLSYLIFYILTTSPRDVSAPIIYMRRFRCNKLITPQPPIKITHKANSSKRYKG
jgi:hypothetical protein